MPGRRGVAGKFPAEQCAIVAVNIRALRQRKGWSQAKLGELMGWQSTIPGGDHPDAPGLTHPVRHGHTVVRR